MAFDLPSRLPLLAFAIVAVALGSLALAGSGLGAAPRCSSFVSQADAQDDFAQLGGGPRRAVGDLDGDRDGIACEGLPGPFKAFATIGYNRRGSFFYGVASMPPSPSGDGYPCLYGNRHFPDGPRLLNVYKVQPGADRAIFAVFGAEAKPESGRLVWKAERDVVVPGHYYAAFEEKIRMSPYGDNECPGFRSDEIPLP